MTSATTLKHVLSPSETETIVSPWVTAKVMASPSASGSEKMSAVSLFFNPGQGHARHNHPLSEQFIFVVSGEGEMMIEDESGKPVKTAILSMRFATSPRVSSCANRRPSTGTTSRLNRLS